MTDQPTVGEQVFDDEYFADPAATYAKLHASGCPVHRVTTPEGFSAWLVSGYDAVRSGLKDARLSRRLANAGPDYLVKPYPNEMVGVSVLTEDPPEHTRLRGLLNYAFLPRQITKLRPRIEELTERLFDGIAERLEREGRADLVTDLALPLPLTIIAEILGIPMERREDFHRWGDGMLDLDPEVQRKAGGAMLAFLTELMQAKAVAPADDMLSHWVTTRDENGNPLTPDEIIGLAFVVLLAGYDTSVGAIAATLLSLLSDRERLDQLVADPTLVPSVVEEYLRLYPSGHTGVRRFATEDFVIGGQEVAKGDTVLLSIGAANRDPKRYPDPDTADFSRPANRSHLAFGIGPHVCPGNELARMELGIVLNAFLRRFTHLRLAIPVEEIPWRRAYFIRVALSVPVVPGDDAQR